MNDKQKALREKVAKIISGAPFPSARSKSKADEVIAVMREEAAAVADDKTVRANTNDMFEAGWVSACDEIAAAIREM